jgi:hypothetical protein
MLTASLVLDLAANPVHSIRDADRQKVHQAGLDAAPDGTRVIVLVGSRRWSVDLFAVQTLHQHAARLHLDVRGNDGETITAWHRAIRDGAIR